MIATIVMVARMLQQRFNGWRDVGSLWFTKLVIFVTSVDYVPQQTQLGVWD
jgi:hypothetical protein